MVRLTENQKIAAQELKVPGAYLVHVYSASANDRGSWWIRGRGRASEKRINAATAYGLISKQIVALRCSRDGESIFVCGRRHE